MATTMAREAEAGLHEDEAEVVAQVRAGSPPLLTYGQAEEVVVGFGFPRAMWEQMARDGVVDRVAVPGSAWGRYRREQVLEQVVAVLIGA